MKSIYFFKTLLPVGFCLAAGFVQAQKLDCFRLPEQKATDGESTKMEFLSENDCVQLLLSQEGDITVEIFTTDEEKTGGAWSLKETHVLAYNAAAEAIPAEMTTCQPGSGKLKVTLKGLPAVVNGVKVIFDTAEIFSNLSKKDDCNDF